MGVGTTTITAKAGDKTASVDIEVISGEHYGMIKEVFPDPLLASHIATQLGLSVNDLFTVEDSKKITTITRNTMYWDVKMESVEGIEYLPNLKSLMIWEFNGKLKNIDVSKNPKLERLCLCSEPIKNLDLSNNPKLKELWLASYDELPNLDLSNNTELEILDFSGNIKIKNLDLSKNLQLRELTIRDTSLEYLDLSKHTKLEKIVSEYNKAVIIRPDHLLD